ncbi:MAG TPA: adenosyl-hopene transferase HpnH, partial [Armatimonadota bacterium]|nr:adenosyl-hopene transferase HpnH [Armatimonadota bacterium]
MRFPLVLTTSLAEYIIKNKLAGRKQFPLVLMLEPLHRCNLSCAGCGRIREYHASLDQILTPEQCLAAVAECGAPVVSICGGEPLIYSQIGILCEQILAQGKFIYLCTNGTLLAQKLGDFHPHSHFFINVQLDGMEETHDHCAGRTGVFQAALQGIQAAKAAGFMVCTNTTVYRETDMKEVEDLLAL